MNRRVAFETMLFMFFLSTSMLLLIAYTNSGCAAGTGTRIASDVINCVEKSVAGKSPELVKQVYDILDGSPLNWNTALAALESAGLNALGCAALAVFGDLTVKAQLAAKRGDTVAAAFHTRKAVALGKYLSRKQLKFVVQVPR